VVAAEGMLADARAFLHAVAEGPTLAHAATKAVVRAQCDSGTRGADARTSALTSHLFESADSRNAVRSFLVDGPGKARFSGK
jgi:enoyl-CoA hydratase